MTNVPSMTALTTPKGPLPARVYWFRRLMLLTVVFLVVFGTARLLTGSSDGKADGAVSPVSAGTQESPELDPEAAASTTPTVAARPRKKTPPPLPIPSGVCGNEDVVVTPVIAAERTTVQVPITLVLRTKNTAACTWQVSPRSVTVKIDSGADEIWHSRHCPSVIGTHDVTLYQETDTEVKMVWNGRRSDDECSNLTDWARKGWYHVNAAAYAGEPTSVQFELRRPSAVTVTQTADPKPKSKTKAEPKTKTEPKKKSPSTPKPSGAVEPDL